MSKLYPALVCSALTLIGLASQGCSKNPDEITLQELRGSDSASAWEAISKASPDREQALRATIARIERHDSIKNCISMTVPQLEANQKAWESYAGPRMDMYNKVVSYLKKNYLKIPTSGRFGSFDGVDSDSVRIEYSGADSATVIGLFEAQNAFGVYLPGDYKAEFVRVGKDWKWQWNKSDEPSMYLDLVVH